LEELVAGLLRPRLFPFGKLSKAKSAAQFLFWEMRGLSPNLNIHVYVSYLYISRIGPLISLQQNR
jgi:hypothetical protein